LLLTPRWVGHTSPVTPDEPRPDRCQSHNESQMDDHPSRGVAKADRAVVTSPEHHWIALGRGRVDGVSRT
jgi:hypothetical protein